MRDGLPFLFLPGSDEFLPPCFFQVGAAIFLFFKVCPPDDTVIDQRDHQTIHKNSAQFFHEVERQRLPPGTWCVQETDVCVQSDALERCRAVMGQQGIAEGEHGIYASDGRTFRAAGKEECVSLL